MVIRTYQVSGDLNTCELVRIKEKETNTQSGTFPTLYFEIRHNALTTYDQYYNLRLFSFDLSPLKTEFPVADSIKINLSWNDASASENYDFIYTPTVQNGALNSSAKSPGWTKVK
jgi:hypothetical protein